MWFNAFFLTAAIFPIQNFGLMCTQILDAQLDAHLAHSMQFGTLFFCVSSERIPTLFCFILLSMPKELMPCSAAVHILLLFVLQLHTKPKEGSVKSLEFLRFTSLGKMWVDQICPIRARDLMILALLNACF